MLLLSGNNIKIARGDSGDITFANPDGFEQGTYYFGVKRSGNWSDPEEPYLFQLKSVAATAGAQTLEFTISKADSDKPIGNYTWGLRFVSGGVVDTLVFNGMFQIIGSVVQNIS